MDIMSLWLIPGLLGSSKYGCRISDSVDISSTQDERSLAISRRHMILFRKKIKTQNVGKVVDFIYESTCAEQLKTLLKLVIGNVR